MKILKLTKEQEHIKNLLFSKQKESRILGWQLDKTHNDSMFRVMLSTLYHDWNDDYDCHYGYIHSMRGEKAMLENILFINLSPYIRDVEIEIREYDVEGKTFDIELPNTLEALQINGICKCIKNVDTLLQGLTNLRYYTNNSPLPIRLHEENINDNLQLRLQLRNLHNGFELLENRTILGLTITGFGLDNIELFESVLPKINANRFDIDNLEVMQRAIFPLGLEELIIQEHNGGNLLDKVYNIKTLKVLHLRCYSVKVDFNKLMDTNIEELYIQAGGVANTIPINKLRNSKLKKIIIGKNILDFSNDAQQ